MTIIIDDLHNSFNFDNYHDGWLIGDHIMIIMDPDIPIYLRHWLAMMRNMADDLLMMIDHEWWLMIMIIDDDSLWLIMAGHGWWLTDRLTDWMNAWLMTRLWLQDLS